MFMYFKYFAAERNGFRQKYINFFGVYSGNVLKCNGLSKLLNVFVGLLVVVIRANFKTVLMKHPVYCYGNIS